MTSRLNHIDRSQRLQRARLLAAIVVPPLLLVILLSLATVGLIRHQKKSSAGVSAEVWDPAKRNRVYDDTTSMERTIDGEETFLAATALESRLDGLGNEVKGQIDLAWAYDPQSAENSIVDIYATESAPVLESIRKIAASEMPVWFTRHSPIRPQGSGFGKLLPVILMEFNSAIRAKDHQRALSALAMIPSLSTNLDYIAAFDQYYWFDSARTAHRRMVVASLEAGFWTDVTQLDAILGQLDEFDAMGSDRAGLPDPWKSVFHDVDRQTKVETNELPLGNRLVVAVFGVRSMTQMGSRAEGIRIADTSQRFVRTAIGIKKYQLLNSEFPRSLSLLQSLGFTSADFRYASARSFQYTVNATGGGELRVPVDHEGEKIFVNPGIVNIR